MPLGQTITVLDSGVGIADLVPLPRGLFDCGTTVFFLLGRQTLRSFMNNGKTRGTR